MFSETIDMNAHTTSDFRSSFDSQMNYVGTADSTKVAGYQYCSSWHGLARQRLDRRGDASAGKTRKELQQAHFGCPTVESISLSGFNVITYMDATSLTLLQQDTWMKFFVKGQGFPHDSASRSYVDERAGSWRLWKVDDLRMIWAWARPLWAGDLPTACTADSAIVDRLVGASVREPGERWRSDLRALLELLQREPERVSQMPWVCSRLLSQSLLFLSLARTIRFDNWGFSEPAHRSDQVRLDPRSRSRKTAQAQLSPLLDRHRAPTANQHSIAGSSQTCQREGQSLNSIWSTPWYRSCRVTETISDS